MQSCFAALLLVALVHSAIATQPTTSFTFTDAFDEPDLGQRTDSLMRWNIDRGNVWVSKDGTANKYIDLQGYQGPQEEGRFQSVISTKDTFQVVAGQSCLLSVDVKSNPDKAGPHTAIFKFGPDGARYLSEPVTLNKERWGWWKRSFRFVASAAHSGQLIIEHSTPDKNNGIFVDNLEFRCGGGCSPGYGFNMEADSCEKCTGGLYSEGGWGACAPCTDPAGRAQGTWDWAVNDGNSEIASCGWHPTTRSGCISPDNKVCEWVLHKEAEVLADARTACQRAGGELATVTGDEAAAFTTFLGSNGITSSMWVDGACDSQCDVSESREYVCEKPLSVVFADSFSSDAANQQQQRELVYWNVTAGNVDVKTGTIDLEGFRSFDKKSEMKTKEWFAVTEGQPCVLTVDVSGNNGISGDHNHMATFKFGNDLSESVTKKNEEDWETMSWGFTVSGTYSSPITVQHVTTANNGGVQLDNVHLSCPSKCAPGYGVDSGECKKCTGGVYSEGGWGGCLPCDQPSGLGSGTWAWGPDTANSVSSSCELFCASGWYYVEQGAQCLACGDTCAAGLNETVACTQSTNRECAICGAGFLCTDGVPQPCNAAEGFFCPEGYVPEGNRRSDSGALGGIPCPAGYYCAGNTANKIPCEAAEGFYCPGQFQPGTPTLEEGLAGRPCPPGAFCEGKKAQPVEVPPLCDLVQACGNRIAANETCGVAQSTFFKYNDPAADVAVDGEDSTCMKTATADTDSNPQWLRVALGKERLVGTVRFWSSGAASDFEVLVTAEDAAPVDGQNEAERQNPSQGGALPALREACAVAEASSGVFEASCPPATKGAFVFIRRATDGTILEVCELEVYGHACVSEEEVECPLGYGPSACTDADALCRGCVPCMAGTYSDKVGPYACTPCPGHGLYGEPPYSPEGSTSVFQCEGDAHLDGTSTLEVVPGGVTFNTAIDAWEILIEFEVARRIQINGLSTIFMSKGGDAAVANADTFQSKNFPCRADASRAAGSDVSARLEETVCCLQDMRQDYLMTKLFRDWTDGEDLVAANDVCDGEDGSDMLVNSDLEVVGDGTIMVDTDGSSFANAITVEPVPPPEARRSHESYSGVQRAKITIPDAELYKISKSFNQDGNLTDSRELFVGLLDMLPTGTRVVNSASQQISIVLTRTQYGTFAAYGEQNIDYDFISFLNARAHKVISKTEDQDLRRDLLPHQYYAEITFVYDDRLEPMSVPGAVQLDTVTVNGDGTPAAHRCDGGLSGDFKAVVSQTCGPKDLPWKDQACPQVSIPDDHFGRLYIPLAAGDLDAGVIHIEFALWFKDKGGRDDKVTLAMDLVVEDFVTWCDADEESVDLARLVTPRIIVGTEADSPLRLTGWSDMGDSSPFTTGAETLQDGLVALILELDDDKGKTDNLEVFFEDVLVIHVNPGSQPDLNAIKNAVSGEDSKYMPTRNYDPDSRDAWINIPEALKTDCPAEDATVSFFGCVHKHILRNKVITNETDAYFVGSAPPPSAGAQDFVETMLGDGTASVAARELGRDFESYLMTEEGVTGTSSKRIGLWINPGHKWGGVTANSEYSLSNHIIIHVLFGVRSGIDGSERRMLLSTNGDGTTSLVRTLEYNVNAATLVESVMDNVIAIEVEARLALSADEACMPLASLREICSERLRAAVAPHASKIERVECVSVQVENANCDGARRSSSDPEAAIDAVIAFQDSPDAFLDLDAVMAAGGVLAMTQTAGKAVATPSDKTTPDQVEAPAAAAADGDSSSSNTMVIGAAAGATAGVVLLALVAWQATKCRAQPEPLTEIVSAGVVSQSSGHMDKVAIETLMFGDSPQAPGTRFGDSQKRLLEQA